MEYPEENALNIYTDGSMLPGPRRGGGGILFVLVDDEGNEEQREEVLRGYANATQNQMELEAPIQALKMVIGRHPPFDPSRYGKIVIKTDAMHVAENFGTAVSVWSRNGWTTRDGKPVDNGPQWKELVRLAVLSGKQGKRVWVVRVPGKKSPRTKAVDKLAKTSARGASQRQLKPAEVRRKKTDQRIEIGAVGMHGHVMTTTSSRASTNDCTTYRSTGTRSCQRTARTTGVRALSIRSYITCVGASTASA